MEAREKWYNGKATTHQAYSPVKKEFYDDPIVVYSADLQLEELLLESETLTLLLASSRSTQV
jgi:hypothetical protein